MSQWNKYGLVKTQIEYNLEKEIKKLRDALEVYARKDNYKECWDWAQGIGQIKIEPMTAKDRGKRAREALKETDDGRD